MRQREWAFLRENILTQNVDIINRLCKEVEELMHLLQGVTFGGTVPFFALLVAAALTHTWRSTKTHTTSHEQRCVCGQDGSKSDVLEVVLSCGGGGSSATDNDVISA